jgi:Dopa 4,5-dioxygenase family
MFEVNTFTPHQTGALFSFLTVYRGPCSWVHSDISPLSRVLYCGWIAADIFRLLFSSRDTPSLLFSPSALFHHPNNLRVDMRLDSASHPYSVLIHPNTDDAYKDHTELMTWMGTPWPLNASLLKHWTLRINLACREERKKERKETSREGIKHDRRTWISNSYFCQYIQLDAAWLEKRPTVERKALGASGQWRSDRNINWWKISTTVANLKRQRRSIVELKHI